MNCTNANQCPRASQLACLMRRVLPTELTELPKSKEKEGGKQLRYKNLCRTKKRLKRKIVFSGREGYNACKKQLKGPNLNNFEQWKRFIMFRRKAKSWSFHCFVAKIHYLS